jgi:SAGA-associated factor 73
MLAMVANEHITTCIQKKNEKAQRKKEQKEANRKAREAQQKAERAEEEAALDAEGDDDSVNGDKTMGKKSAIKGSAGTSKKRKADDEADKNPLKKKTKKELEAAKPKAAKPKGPVDVEKQCGVLLPNGAMCARSLTCKSHAMGAKRAVPGRSLPYDMLLAAYQKKNQAKQQSQYLKTLQLLLLTGL